MGVVGPDGALFAKWMSNGFTHGFAFPLDVPGRDPNPDFGLARLVDDPLFAPNRVPNPDDDGLIKLVTDPLLSPNRARIFISEACSFMPPAELPDLVEPGEDKSNMLAAA